MYAEIANCDADIAYFAGRHHKDTRQWLFEDFDKWFSDPGDSRAYVLLGDAGVGKSVIAGALAQRMMKAGHLGAAYFCRHNEVTRNNPRFLLGTLACQLCNGNGQYSNLMGGEDGVRRLLANSNLGIQELCTKLLEEPLFKCRSFQQRKLVVIDALDETQYSSRKDFIFLVKERFLRLPEWLLFFITSRPEDMLQSRLEKYNPCVRICTGQGEHRSFYECHEQDIQRYLENTVDFSGLPYSVKDVTEKCCGLFLYAFFVAKELNGLLLSGKVDQVSNSFPGDIEDFFETNLKRVYVKIGGDLYRKLLGSIMAAPSPLPVSFISFILNRESSRLNEQEVIDAVSLFVGIQKAVSFLHNLIPAWLTNKKKAQELYIDEKGAGEFLTEIVKEILSAFVGEPGPKLTSVERDLQICFVHFGVQLLCQRGGEDSLSLVFRCLTSYCFLEERICSGRFGIYHLLKDIERAVCCLASGTKKQNVLRKMSLALENDAHVLVESPHLLRSSIRNASDVVQEKVSIPDVSLPWFEWNVFDLSAFDILSGCYCFATTSDKETVVGAKGRSLFFFNSSMLQTVSGPFEISEDIIAGINHLEFSSDDKFIFFGRLDKWFSVDRGFLEDLPQFSGNVAVYQWGSVTPNGHCIVVKTNVLHFPRMCKRGCCFTELVALWALKEIENSRDEERTCSFGELSKRITRIDIMGRHTRNLMEYLGVDPRSYQGLVMFAPDDPSCYWCGRLKKLTESNQELYLATVRQRIIELYPCFFRYQIWNLQSGQPLLHDIFHQNAQLNPFVYFCHVSGAVDDWAKAIKCSGVIETVSVCNIAVVTAVYFVLKLKFELCRNGHVLETMEPDWERMKENEDYATYVRQLLLEMKDEESDKDSQCYVLLHQLERCINQEENPKLLQNKWVKLLSLFSECSTLERLRFPDFKRDSFLTCNPQNPDFLTHFPKGFLDLFRKNVSLCFSPEKNWIIQSWSYGGVCLQQTRSHEDNSRNTRCSSSEALHAQSLQKDNVFLRKSRNSHFLHGVESLTFTNDDLFALYSSFGDLLHALSLQTGKVFTSVRGCNFVLFKKQKQVGYLFRRGAEEKAIYLKHLFSPFKFFFRRLQVGKSVAAMFISSYTVTSVSSESVLSLWDFQNDNAISAVHAFSFPKLRYVTRDLCFAHFLEAMPSLSFSATTQTSLQDDVQKQGSVTNKCVFSPDGEVIALLEQNEITVHCVTKFNRTRVHHSVFKSEFDIMDAHLNFSADNSLLFICIQDDFMGPYFYVWDVEKKSMSGSFKSPGPLTVDCFCLSPDLNNLILCGGGYEIEIWEFKKHPRFLLKKMEVEGFYSPVKFSQCSVSSNNELLVCCISNLIYVFNFLVAHTLIYSSRRILRGHVSKIENCRFLKVNRYLISYDIDGMVFLWNITESKAIGFARIVQGQEKIASMAVSPEEDRVVCFLSSNRVCVIDLYKLESAMCTKVSTVLTKNKEKATESRIHLAERIPLTSNIPTSSADEFKPEASSSSDSEESYITDNDFYEFPESD